MFINIPNGCDALSTRVIMSVSAAPLLLRTTQITQFLYFGSRSLCIQLEHYFSFQLFEGSSWQCWYWGWHLVPFPRPCWYLISCQHGCSPKGRCHPHTLSLLVACVDPIVYPNVYLLLFPWCPWVVVNRLSSIITKFSWCEKNVPRITHDLTPKFGHVKDCRLTQAKFVSPW